MQLAKLCELAYNHELRDDDVIFLADAWFPGLEMLSYIRDGLGLKFKIMGCLHAGSYDPYDFLAKKGMEYWAESIENGWFKILDKIFVATNFHKQFVCSKRKIDHKKVIVTGFPIYDEQKHDIKKENIMVFPHRLDSEKNPQLFDYLEQQIHLRYPRLLWKFVKTKDVTKTKQEYYDLLKKSKIAISYANQETWGIAMQEALFARCIPIVPNRLSYSELYDPLFKYGRGTTEESISLVVKAMTQRDLFIDALERNRKVLLEKGSKAIGNMISEIVSC